ncbi:protein trichome berefringence-like 7 [Lolium rigidum]|uniref:protein trichome berefringence-like 7 n=1 Tax=Lolium rigidum TaxID=89674 RepID=UPI001F5D20D9|nr:protein trichome berefringence-like 7 [Lolium rigidum]
MVTGSFSRSTSARLTARGGAGSPRVAAAQRKWWWWVSPSAAPSLETIALACFLACCALVLSGGLYLSVSRYLGRDRAVADFAAGEDLHSCDVFDGSWVRDERYPLYNSSECAFAERGFNCLANGRRSTEYLKWRWRPRRCDLPRFSARRALEWLRGKRVVFVGDSMSRTQWESFICMLMTGVDDPRTVYEVNGNQISKTIRFLGVRFESFDLSDGTVFEKHSVTEFSFLRSGLNQKVCEVTEKPTTEAKGTDMSEFRDILADVVANMSVPVTILNVTLMGAFRSDAHIGIWSHPSTILDCSHWCLPGVPDAWNELIFSHLLTNGWRTLAT